MHRRVQWRYTQHVHCLRKVQIYFFPDCNVNMHPLHIVQPLLNSIFKKRKKKEVVKVWQTAIVSGGFKVVVLPEQHVSEMVLRCFYFKFKEWWQTGFWTIALCGAVGAMSEQRSQFLWSPAVELWGERRSTQCLSVCFSPELKGSVAQGGRAGRMNASWAFTLMSHFKKSDTYRI